MKAFYKVILVVARTIAYPLLAYLLLKIVTLLVMVIANPMNLADIITAGVQELVLVGVPYCGVQLIAVLAAKNIKT